MGISEKKWILKSRRLSQFLILSMTLNICLLLTFGIKAYQGSKVNVKPALHSYENSKNTISNSEILVQYFDLSFYQLLDELYNDTLVEDGFRMRDLALSCLVDYHYFDIDKALQGVSIQRRRMNFVHKDGQEVITLSIFPALVNEHFDAMLYFARKEKWPFTSEGLFMELISSPENETLNEAFALSDHFQLVDKLFTRSGNAIEKAELIALLKEGEWRYLDRFMRAQMKSVNLSRSMYEAFLFQYVNGGSSVAANHIIETNQELMLRHMDDKALLKLIKLLNKNCDKVELFLKRMIISVRSDDVRKESALKLFEFYGGRAPSPYDHMVALKQLMPQITHHVEPTIQKSSSLKEYIVKPGDSLWIIARKYGTSVNAIMRENDLSSKHRLKIGMHLIIP